MLAEVQSHNADVTGRAMTAKDEQNARLQERAKFVDLLDAAGQLRKAQISLMRQGNTLDDWLASLPKM
jgi:muconolactone delta-isomerase